MFSTRQTSGYRRDADQKALALATVIVWLLVFAVSAAFLA